MSVFMLLLLAWLYFLPALIARRRRHRQAVAIFVLNLLAGWTAVGWVVAIVWAFIKPAPIGAQGAAAAQGAVR